MLRVLQVSDNIYDRVSKSYRSYHRFKRTDVAYENLVIDFDDYKTVLVPERARFPCPFRAGFRDLRKALKYRNRPKHA